MTKKKTISAIKFRLLTAVALMVILLGITAGSIFGYQLLKKKADETAQVVYEATTSEERIANIQQGAAFIEANRDIVERAKQITADGQNNKVQTIIVKELGQIASKSGVRIKNYDFAANDPSGQGGAAAPTTPPGEPSAVPNGPGAPSAALRTTTVNLTIESPLEYTRLLNFLHHIEQNLTKMQVAKVSLSKGGEDSKNLVSTEVLTIEVYVK